MKTPDITVAVLAGGNSKRFRSEKALAEYRGITLLEHMIRVARTLSPSIIVVVSDIKQAESFGSVVGEDIIKVDPEDSVRCALTGAITAFEYANTDYTMLLPVDAPLTNISLMKTLMKMAPPHGAVVPIWPSGYIEPLHAVYRSEHAYERGLYTMECGKRRMQDLLDALRNVLYISTDALRLFDSELCTFTNINTESDLQELKQTGRRRH